jgi:hypothetical protein
MALNLDHQRDRITAPGGNITINANGSLRLPVGTTAQRPQAGVVQTGQIRFNTQTTEFEGYNGTQWNSLTGVFDNDGDTFISAEENPDDDTLRFFTVNQERLTISSTGEVTIYTDTTITQDLTVQANSYFTGLMDVDSQATIASLNVEDLTDNRVIFAGAQGELEDDANLTFDGSVFDIDTVEALGLPRGTTAQRPSAPRPGYLRFNIDTNVSEFWDGSTWSAVGTGTGNVQEAFKTISIQGQTDIEADGPTDTLTLVAGNGITLTTDPSTDTITITASVTSPYGDSDVDAHLNTSTATTGQVLSWDGADYAWIAQGGGGSGFSDKIEDADGDTHVKVETNADEDYIRMTTAGTEVMSIDNTGIITVGDSAGTTYYKFPTARGTLGQVLALDGSGNLSFQTLSGGGGGGGGTVYYQDAVPSIGISAGDLWFDTGTTGELYVYSGSEWISTTPGADTGFIKQNYTGDGSTTQYDTQTGVNGGTVSLVFLNGVLVQPTNDYTESGGVVTFVAAPLNGDQIDIMITGELVTLSLNPLGLNNHNLITVDASGNVEVNSLAVADLTDNRIVLAGTNGELEDNANLTFDGTVMTVNTTGALQLPVGSTGQQPTPVVGMIRYNTTDGSFEGYDGSAWGALGGGSSFDQSLNTTDDVTFNTVSVTAGSLTIDSVSKLETASQTLATTTQTAIDTFATTDYRSCKYTVQATDTVSSEYQVVEILLIHDGTTAYVTTYGIIHTGASEIVTFDADVNAGNVRLLATGASANSTQYKVTRISTLV